MDESKYIKGFNAGYLMQKHDPELYQKIHNNLSGKSAFTQGVKDGSSQFTKELIEKTKDGVQKMMPDKLRSAPSPAKGKNQSKSLDK